LETSAAVPLGCVRFVFAKDRPYEAGSQPDFFSLMNVLVVIFSCADGAHWKKNQQPQRN
jgi:hypothetical protein